MERLSAKFTGNYNSFMEIWRPRTDHLPRDLSDAIERERAH